MIGLDAGGSKTRLRAEWCNGGESVELQGPGANPNRIGLDEAGEVLVDLVEEALRSGTSVDRLSVCAGVSGAGRPHEQNPLREALREAFSGRDITVSAEVVHDALIALDAAYDTGSGVIVIAGTGSVVLGRSVNDDLFRVGGWGHLLKDPGSGYAIGQDGLRAVAAAYDGGRETALTARLRENTGIKNRERLIRRVYEAEFKVQSVAPIVISTAASGDEVATEILEHQARELVEQIGWVLRRDEDITRRITLLGGMVWNDYYMRILCEILNDEFPEWSVDLLKNDPVQGALRRARRL